MTGGIPLNRLIRALSATAFAALAGAGVAAASPAASSPPSGSSYVALGDSYAAGYGLPGLTKRPVAACGQSAQDYPHRVATALGLQLTDVSCATATTADLLARSGQGAPAQISALGATTRTVTLTIGGNDSDLFSQAFSCVALTADGPVIAGKDVPDCRSSFVQNGVDTLQRTVDTTIRADIGSSLRAIRAAAPNAVIVVVGYPTIFPDPANTPADGCFVPAITAGTLTGSYPDSSFPFTDTDVRYFHDLQVTLDAATRSAALQQGVTYVPMHDAPAAHSACATAEPYVNGLHLTSGKDVEHVELDPGALHPNAAGAAALATAAEDGIRTANAQRAAAEAPKPAAASSEEPPWLLWGTIGVVVAAAITAVVLVVRRRHPKDHPLER